MKPVVHMAYASVIITTQIVLKQQLNQKAQFIPSYYWGLGVNPNYQEGKVRVKHLKGGRKQN